MLTTEEVTYTTVLRTHSAQIANNAGLASQIAGLYADSSRSECLILLESRVIGLKCLCDFMPEHSIERFALGKPYQWAVGIASTIIKVPGS